MNDSITMDCMQLKKALDRRVKMEKIVNDAAIQLINVDDKEFDRTVSRIIQILGEFAHAERSYIFLFTDNYQKMSNTHEWCTLGTEPQITNLQNITTEYFPWWMDKMKNGENIYIANVSDMPPEASGEKEILEMQDIQSLIVVPMYAKNKLTGYIGFDSVTRTLTWPEVDGYMLRTVGDIIASVMERNNFESKLLFEHRQLLNIFDSIEEAIYISDPETHEILYVNNFLKKQIGKNPIGKICHNVLQNRETPCPFCNNEILLLNKGKSIRWESYNPLFDKYYQLIDRIITWPDGRDVRFEIAIDITRLKESENNLSAANRIINNSQAIVFLWKNEDGWPVEYVSESVEDIFGYSKEEFLSGNIPYAKIIHPDDLAKVSETVSRYGIENVNKQIELEPYRIITKNGDVKWIDERSTVKTDGQGNITHYHGVILDITSRIHSEKQLRQYSETQAVLLREVNHRVKNNLAAIISMLHQEEDRAAENELNEYIPVLRDLVGRVRGLLTVHTLLSAREWKPLDMGVLCTEVIKGALQGLPRNKTILFDVTADSVLIDSEHAHNITLLLNELTTNSMKHALNGYDKANIKVAVKRNGNNISLSFKDDGPGYPQELINGDYTKASIGFNLIRGIAMQSLDGQVRFANESGAVTFIDFEYSEPQIDAALELENV